MWVTYKIFTHKYEIGQTWKDSIIYLIFSILILTKKTCTGSVYQASLCVKNFFSDIKKNSYFLNDGNIAILL